MTIDPHQNAGELISVYPPHRARLRDAADQEQRGAAVKKTAMLRLVAKSCSSWELRNQWVSIRQL